LKQNNSFKPNQYIYTVKHFMTIRLQTDNTAILVSANVLMKTYLSITRVSYLVLREQENDV